MATRAFIRRRVGRATRQMILLVATSNGTTTTIIDTINGSDPTSTLLGRVGWVASGTAANLGRTVRVTGNTESTSTITFTPALPSATATADEIELWNDLDQGVTPQEVHELIDMAIEAVADQYPLVAIDDEQTFDADSPVLDIPVDWDWFSGVDYQDVSGYWHPVYQNQIRVNDANRTVELIYPARTSFDTLNVRLRGATRPTAASSDSTDIPIDAEFLIKYVSYHVLMNASYTAMDGVAMERRASTFKAEAEALRLKARQHVSGMGKKLTA
jgi:hypothetical protein